MKVRFLLLIISCLFLYSCKATYKDISQQAAFQNYIGGRYILKSDMDFSGVNAPPGYSNEIHYFVISSRDPGWTGPEVVTRETLAKDSVFTVHSIKECTNCLTFGKPVRHALVTLDGVYSTIKLPIRIYFQEIELGKHIERVSNT